MLVLVLGFAVKQSAGSWKAAVIVGKMLIDSFTSSYVERTSVTAAEELVRGLTFDRYNEKIGLFLIYRKLKSLIIHISRVEIINHSYTE